MEYVESIEFAQRTADGRACREYDFSLYYGLSFQCACGREHDFRPWMEIVSELPLLRFVLTCPDGMHMTVLKARWDREAAVRSLESELGTALGERRDMRSGIEYQARLPEARTGRSCSPRETAESTRKQVDPAWRRKGRSETG